MNKRERKFLTIALVGAFAFASLGIMSHAIPNGLLNASNRLASNHPAVYDRLCANPHGPWWDICDN